MAMMNSAGRRAAAPNAAWRDRAQQIRLGDATEPGEKFRVAYQGGHGPEHADPDQYRGRELGYRVERRHVVVTQQVAVHEPGNDRHYAVAQQLATRFPTQRPAQHGDLICRQWQHRREADQVPRGAAQHRRCESRDDADAGRVEQGCPEEFAGIVGAHVGQPYGGHRQQPHERRAQEPEQGRRQAAEGLQAQQGKLAAGGACPRVFDEFHGAPA
jgi:hypothetical protein